MPGVHSTTPEMIQLSRLSPEIPRIDILEQEQDGGQTVLGNNFFDMFSSQFSGSSSANHNNTNNNSSGITNTTSSSDEKPGSFPVFHSPAIQQQAAAAAAHGFDSFQFLGHSMFGGGEREKHELEEPPTAVVTSFKQASPSSAELDAPITKLWTGDYDDGGLSCEQQPYESVDASSLRPGPGPLGVSLKGNSSWGVSRSSTVVEPPGTGNAKPKRKRPRPCKSSEEVESQRMTHIAVERNRRRQMNEHLRVLRGLMPGSYVQRGDQASIIGGAIEFVKELQHILHCLEDQKKRKMSLVESPVRLLAGLSSSPSAIPNITCAGMIPYNSQSPAGAGAGAGARGLSPPADVKFLDPALYNPVREFYGKAETPLATVDVKIVGLAAFIRILSQKKPGQLLRIMTALENKLQLSIVHINVTTIDPSVLYAFEIGHNCGTADELAVFVHHTLESASLEFEELQLHD